MMENRELTVDDYLAMFRRRLTMILIPTILAPLAGFGLSYAFQPKYTSRATVLVEEQKVPEGYVSPVITQDLSNRVATLEQRALTAERLRPLIENLKLVEGSSLGAKINEIRLNIAIQPMPAITLPSSRGDGRRGQVPGFYLEYTASNPQDAQAICTGLINIMLQENLRGRAQVAQETNQFLARQIEDEKRKLDDMDNRLADFKKRYIGQLPGDAEKNMQLLLAMNSQLDANTQALNRAQQDKSYTESMLAQQLAAWKASQNASGGANPQTLDKQLSDLQGQLLQLKSRYTDDYPEVLKTKKDIQELKRQIAEANAAASTSPAVTSNKGEMNEPPEIRQLRLQIHQYQQTIAQTTRDQQKLEEQIRMYQGRVALSPGIEEQYTQLTRDYATMQKVYDDDIARKRAAEKQTAMELEQQGEQMTVLNAADLPQSPSFPNRFLFAGGGLGGGLALGFGLALWLELRDQCVRTEQDVLAVLGIPVLSQVPWVREEDTEKNQRRQVKPGVKLSPEPKKEIVEV